MSFGWIVSHTEIHHVLHQKQTCDLENATMLIIFGKLPKVNLRYIPTKLESYCSHSVWNKSNGNCVHMQASKTELLPLFFDLHRKIRFQYIWFVVINIHTKFGAIQLNSVPDTDSSSFLFNAGLWPWKCAKVNHIRQNCKGQSQVYSCQVWKS